MSVWVSLGCIRPAMAQSNFVNADRGANTIQVFAPYS